MTKSMTGFARVQAEGELGTLSIELKSVNSRYLDIFFKIPDAIKPFEHALRQTLTKRLRRGKVECAIRFSAKADEKLSINEDYVTALLSVTNSLSQSHRIDNVSVGELLRLPNVLIENAPDADALKNWLLPLFEQAINELIEQRHSEGEHLHQLISERLASIQQIIRDVENHYCESTSNVRERLLSKLGEIVEQLEKPLDESRFEQEMIYLLQKMDIAEEIDRLNGHIAEVNKLLQATAPVGRKLDFLMQEMNRESNTIASKSQHLGLTLNAVELKVLLEQMREQIQNIE